MVEGWGGRPIRVGRGEKYYKKREHTRLDESGPSAAILNNTHTQKKGKTKE
jgi:hypothetical protein